MSPRSLALTFRITGTGTCASADGDGDGVADDVDNCPSVANADQADADADGVGDLCDRNAFAPGVHHAADPNPATGPEGSPLFVDGSFSDGDGTAPALSKVSGRGDLADNGDGTWSWSLTPADDGGGNVQVKADDGAHTATDSFAWSAFNVAPTADISNDGPIDEGGSATVSLTNPSDPSSEDTTAGFHYAFSCTNDALPTTYADAGTSDSILCPFADDGSYKVSARIFDKDDGYTDYDTTVVVRNVAPTITSATVTGGSGVACLPGNAVGLDFAWTDPAGSHDTYSYDVDWGDGSAHAKGSGQVSPVTGLSHTYGPGSFTMSIVVSDEDGGSSDAVTRQVSHEFATSGLLPADQRGRAHDLQARQHDPGEGPCHRLHGRSGRRARPARPPCDGRVRCAGRGQQRRHGHALHGRPVPLQPVDEAEPVRRRPGPDGGHLPPVGHGPDRLDGRCLRPAVGAAARRAPPRRAASSRCPRGPGCGSATRSDP